MIHEDLTLRAKETIKYPNRYSHSKS